ncbi:MAG: hypothetical protein IPN85_01675 [Flavobacteriales bacterium]|nr:hypothetical protein [Flavobacteriales bacterium]MBL0034478.1 hypothetical protein [Flavobacteriales bacterium]
MSPSLRFRAMRGVVVTALFVAMPSCKHGKCEDGGSSSAGRDSHNAGADCQSCHLPDGEGEGCWTIGGTVYDPNGDHPSAAAQFRLFTAPLGKGSLKLQLEGDQNGNVYTSQDVAFGNGLFAAVINANGDTAFMSEAIRDGACNRCHGRSTDRIELP